MKLTDRRYSVKEVIGILSIVMVFVAAISYGAVTIPNTFSAGTTAKASEVNANFNYLADRSWDKTTSGLNYNVGNVVIGTMKSNFDTHKFIVSGQSITPFPNNPVMVGFFTEDAQAANMGAGISLGGVVSGTWATNFAYIGGLKENSTDNNSSGKLVFGTRLNGNDGATDMVKMTILSSGNVGIGVTSPTYPLEMASGAYVTAGGVWTNASSREYKNNIARLEASDALKALKELEPVTFSYKADKSEKHAGFIAEDVPALLATKDRKGLSSMDMVAVLTKVVQEQQRTIELLQEKMAKIESSR